MNAIEARRFADEINLYKKIKKNSKTVESDFHRVSNAINLAVTKGQYSITVGISPKPLYSEDIDMLTRLNIIKDILCKTGFTVEILQNTNSLNITW